ncbi:MAG TPA: FAD-binding oxidoreductase [Chloroflexi bacterium]|nr:FAD-binding oxidoreductase [Chloroflexota bacterium]
MGIEQGQKRIDTCDVLVVGAGLVGAAVAARLTQEGLDTAILEAQEIAGGATGRSAGMVLTGLAGHYSSAIDVYGRETARQIWALTTQGRDRLVETAERLGVPCQRTGSLALATDEAAAGFLETSARQLQEDGFDVEFEPGDPLERDFRAVLRYPDDATVDAAALTRALIAQHDVLIHEGAEVYGLEAERGARENGFEKGIRVWAHGRTVLCGAVVLAVNGYAPLINAYFADKIAPTRSLVFATAPLDHVVLGQPCYTDYADYADYGYTYCRQMPDRRLLVGGWRRPRIRSQEANQGRDEQGPEELLQQGLVRFISRHFPDVPSARIDDARRWSGIMGFTGNGFPLLGRLPDLPGVYFAVGLGGRGLAWAFVLAERIAEAVLHQADPTLDLPHKSRNP